MIANHKGEIPFVILIIPFLLGITLGLNFHWYYHIDILSVLLILCIVFVSLNIAYKKLNLYKTRWLGGLFISLILFVFGWIIVAQYSELNCGNHFSKTPSQYVIVRINNEPVMKNGLLRFTANVEESINKQIKTATTGTLLITLKDSAAKNLNYGDELLIPANYSVVDPPFNPAEFNYKQYLAHQNIYYQSFLYGKEYVVIEHNTGNPIIAYALRLRQQLVEKLKLNIHNPDAVAIASALLLGYRADLSSDILQAYSKTGTIYVLTVSGAQVGVIYYLLALALGFLARHKYGKILRAIIIIAALCYYALLTGFSPAVCRAVLVVSLIIIGKTYNRYINTLNILAVSAFLLLIYDPFLITEVGFQLAYLAVAGLIVFRPVVYKWFTFKNKVADKAWSYCSVSIAAQIITFPLSAFYFHQFPVYFLVSNILAIIPTTIIMFGGLAYLLLPQLPFMSKSLGYIIEHTILLMNRTLNTIEQFPLSTINKIWINTADYLLLYLLIISLFYFLYSRKVWLLQLSLVCTLLLCISFSYKKINDAGNHNIAFLNMRKHIGIVMSSGTNATVLSDLADTDKNYRYSIQPYLDSCKISKVNLYNLKQDFTSPYVIKKGNLTQFEDSKILILDKKLAGCALTGTLKTNYVYVTQSPHIDINAINKNFSYKILIVDATNSNRYVAGLQQQATTIKINYVLLKRNKSLLVVSN